MAKLRTLLDGLTAPQREVWDHMAHGHRSALRRLVDQMEARGQHTDFGGLLDVWGWQTDADGIPRCAWTLVPLTAYGLGAPRLLKYDRDAGYEPDNVGIACQAYFRLRAMSRAFGEDGHASVMRWLQQLDHQTAIDPRDPLGKAADGQED